MSDSRSPLFEEGTSKIIFSLLSRFTEQEKKICFSKENFEITHQRKYHFYIARCIITSLSLVTWTPTLKSWAQMAKSKNNGQFPWTVSWCFATHKMETSITCNEVSKILLNLQNENNPFGLENALYLFIYFSATLSLLSNFENSYKWTSLFYSLAERYREERFKIKLKGILSGSAGQLKHQTSLDKMNLKRVLSLSLLSSYYLEFTVHPPPHNLSQMNLNRFCLRISIIVFLFLVTSFFSLLSCLSLKSPPPRLSFVFESVLVCASNTLVSYFNTYLTFLCFQLYRSLYYLLTCRSAQARTRALLVNCSISVTWSRSTINIY